MEAIKRAERMHDVHSDIRGPLYIEALKMQEEGKKVLKLNTGNPATFGFPLPKSIEDRKSTRQHLIAAFEMLYSKRAVRPSKKHSTL